MQNILIPTNFSEQAMSCMPALCKQYEAEPLCLVFVHFFRISDSISDLLMLSRRNREYDHVPDLFYRNCEALKLLHPQLVIKIEFFYGSSMANFRDFLEANEVTAVLGPEHCVLEKLNRSSIDPSLFTRRSRMPLVYLAIPLQTLPEQPAAPAQEPIIIEEELVAG